MSQAKASPGKIRLPEVPLFDAAQAWEKKYAHRKRRSESILVPERGARLGNFPITEVSENETWAPNIIIPPENAFGADNTVWAARILWKERERFLSIASRRHAA
jgi:hypothetical protein